MTDEVARAAVDGGWAELSVLIHEIQTTKCQVLNILSSALS